LPPGIVPGRASIDAHQRTHALRSQRLEQAIQVLGCWLGGQAGCRDGQRW
jgi:hypothetical protein